MCWIFNEISNGSLLVAPRKNASGLIKAMAADSDSEEDEDYSAVVEYKSLGCVVKRVKYSIESRLSETINMDDAEDRRIGDDR